MGHTNAGELTDNLAVVSGPGTGVGREPARQRADLGADVAAAARRLPLLNDTVREIDDRGAHALAAAQSAGSLRRCLTTIRYSNARTSLEPTGCDQSRSTDLHILPLSFSGRFPNEQPDDARPDGATVTAVQAIVADGGVMLHARGDRVPSPSCGGRPTSPPRRNRRSATKSLGRHGS